VGSVASAGLERERRRRYNAVRRKSSTPIVLFGGQIWLAIWPWQSKKRERERERESREVVWRKKKGERKRKRNEKEKKKKRRKRKRKKKKRKEKKREGVWVGLISGCLMDLIIGFI
jgi:hypothetical protein